jgi:hypothetical protein
MSLPIFPFKCEDSQVKAGVSCEKQKEIWQNINDLMTGKTTLAPNSVAVGSGLGDASWYEALNYEKIQTELTGKLSEEAKQKAVENISDIQSSTNKKDYLIYGIGLVLLVGIVIFEFKRKKI